MGMCLQKLDEKALADVSLKMTACEPEVDLQHPLLVCRLQVLLSSIIFQVPALIYLNDCTCNTIRGILEPFSSEQFFPPVSPARLKPINSALKLIADICVLQVWDDFESLVSPSSFLSAELNKILEKSAFRYGESLRKQSFEELCRSVQNLWVSLSNESQSYYIFFHQFEINYIGSSMMKLDKAVRTLRPMIMKC